MLENEKLKNEGYSLPEYRRILQCEQEGKEISFVLGILDTGSMRNPRESSSLFLVGMDPVGHRFPGFLDAFFPIVPALNAFPAGPRSQGKWIIDGTKQCRSFVPFATNVNMFDAVGPVRPSVLCIEWLSRTSALPRS